MIASKNFTNWSTSLPQMFGPDVLAEAENSTFANGVLQITLQEDGRITIRGPRPAVTKFLVTCARYGFVIHMEDISWCG